MCPTFENLCEERILSVTLNIFWFKIQRSIFGLFSGGVTSLPTHAHHHHVFFDDESVVFENDVDENDDELLLFVSFERRRRRENAFVRDDDFDDEEKEQEFRHFLYKSTKNNDTIPRRF